MTTQNERSKRERGAEYRPRMIAFHKRSKQLAAQTELTVTSYWNFIYLGWMDVVVVVNTYLHFNLKIALPFLSASKYSSTEY